MLEFYPFPSRTKTLAKRPARNCRFTIAGGFLRMFAARQQIILAERISACEDDRYSSLICDWTRMCLEATCDIKFTPSYPGRLRGMSQAKMGSQKSSGQCTFDRRRCCWQCQIPGLIGDLF